MLKGNMDIGALIWQVFAMTVSKTDIPGELKPAGNSPILSAFGTAPNR